MEAVKKAHVLAVPVPGQGHVKPMMKLCRRIAKRGIKVTLVNLKSIHEKLVAAGGEDKEEDNLILTWIPDPEAENDSNMLQSLRRKLPGSLMELIERINGSDPDDKITCVVADLTFGWVLETADKIGAVGVAFSPTSNAAMALTLQIPKLLEDGILDPDYGSIQKGEKISLSEDIPCWGKDELVWGFSSNLKAQKSFFESAKFISQKFNNQNKWMVITNTCYEIEPSACHLSPILQPVGPLLEMNNSCNFYPQDASCLHWLDTKPPGSVIYVSFGSFASFSQQQLDELALGLELSGRAFLWVVRMDLANGSRAVHPDGFLDRVGEMGKIVEWAPQEKVLAHPSIACFLSHCGWNSTLEGLNNGVPFLCWPYFADQFHNGNYICDKWKIGLRINPDENGIRSRHEIKNKIDMLFCDDSLKDNASSLKGTCEKSVNEGGSSYKNFETFIKYIS